MSQEVRAHQRAQRVKIGGARVIIRKDSERPTSRIGRASEGKVARKSDEKRRLPGEEVERRDEKGRSRKRVKAIHTSESEVSELRGR